MEISNEMTNLQLIEALCGLVERQAAVIRSLATTPEQANCLSDAEKAAIRGAENEYSAILEPDESSDII